MRRWEEIFTGTDRTLIQMAGFGERQNFGAKPALLIIDVTRPFIGSRPQPILEAVKEYPPSCGGAGWKAVDSIKTLLEACRRKRVPVVFTTGDPTLRKFLPGATKRTPQPIKTPDPAGEEIAETIAPLPSELVIRKNKASGFFATPLLMYLQYMGIDTLLITGATTSGCVRATVVDALSYGFICFVVEECTFDRFELSHLVNLFDMNAKYADVISLAEALQYVGGIGSQLRR